MGLLAMLDTVGSGRCSRFMRWWLVAGAASLGWIAQIGPARAIDAFFPTFGNRGIDVRHYALKLDVDAKSHCIDGQAVLAITDIDRYTLDQRHSASGVPIRSFLAKGTLDSTVAALRQTPAMLDFIEKVVGPYPFDGYGAVTADDPALYYALETQALSTFSSTEVNDLTVVHELAHQWFGDAVTVKRWRDLWLAEGFATYFEYLWA